MELLIAIYTISYTVGKAALCVGFVVVGTTILENGIPPFPMEHVAEVMPEVVVKSYEVSDYCVDTIIHYGKLAMYPEIDPELAKFRDRNLAGVIGSWIPFYEWVYPTVPRHVYEARISSPHAYMEYWVPFREWTYPYFPPEIHEYRCRTWLGWAKTLVPFSHKLFTW
jgi:hypothetical protein